MTTTRERNRKLILALIATLALLAMAWTGMVLISKGCSNPSEVAALAMKAIGAVMIIVPGFFGANVLDKAKGFFRGTPSAPESEASS